MMRSVNGFCGHFAAPGVSVLKVSLLDSCRSNILDQLLLPAHGGHPVSIFQGQRTANGGLSANPTEIPVMRYKADEVAWSAGAGQSTLVRGAGALTGPGATAVDSSQNGAVDTNRPAALGVDEVHAQKGGRCAGAEGSPTPTTVSGG